MTSGDDTAGISAVHHAGGSLLFRNGLTEVSTYAEIPVPLVYTQVRPETSQQLSHYFSPVQVVHLGRFRVRKY